MIDNMGIFFVVFIAIAAILANIGVWAPRKTWVRIGAVATAALFIPAAYASVSDLLSRPKPVSLEWVHRNAKEATVLGSRITNGKAISYAESCLGIVEAYKLGDLIGSRSKPLPFSLAPHIRYKGCMDISISNVSKGCQE